MVQQLSETELTHFAVQDNVLLRMGKEISQFPTPICELMRLNDRLFVILHPFPIDQHPDYAGTNLLSLTLDGQIVWKATNLNVKLSKENCLNCYSELYMFDKDDPKLFVISDDERIYFVFDIMTGQTIPLNEVKGMGSTKPIRDRIFARGKSYLRVLPFDPPERSQPRTPS